MFKLNNSKYLTGLFLQIFLGEPYVKRTCIVFNMFEKLHVEYYHVKFQALFQYPIITLSSALDNSSHKDIHLNNKMSSS